MNKYLLLIALLDLQLFGNCALAKTPAEYLTDVKDYTLAPLRWDAADWRWAGGAVVSIAAAYSLDLSVRDHLAPAGTATQSNPDRTRDNVPLAALVVGTFAMGAFRRDKQITNTGWDMGEAALLGSLSSLAFKTIIGRQRPYETASRSRFGQGSDSFPSGHTTAVFAAAQVFADEMPRGQWGWRVLAYGLAGATAYARMDSNAHWLSDTVAGAALGIATGRFISGRSQGSQSKLALWVAPLDRGALVSFAVDTN